MLLECERVLEEVGVLEGLALVIKSTNLLALVLYPSFHLTRFLGTDLSLRNNCIQWRSRTKMTILLLFHGGLIATSVLNNPNGFKLPSQVFLPVSLGFHSWFLNKCFIHYNGYLSCLFFMQILLPSSLWITSNSSLLCQAKIKTIPPLLLMTRLAANYILQCTKALLLARRYISYLSNAIFMASLAGITYF